MVNEKKVSIKYFLNSRIKGENHNGEVYHPLYARINFLGNNTKIRVVNRYGEGLVMTKDTFEQFSELIDGTDLDKSFIKHGKGGIQVLNHELLIERAVQQQYKISGEKFTFSELTENLKHWQRDIYQLMREKLLDDLKKISEQNIGLNEFRSIEFSEVIKTDAAFKNWIELINKDNITTELLISGRCLVTYLHFIAKKFQHDHIRTNAMGKTTVLGTVFSWLYDNEESLFREHLSNSSPEQITDLHSFAAQYLSMEFMKNFYPNESEYEEYIRFVEKIIK